MRRRIAVLLVASVSLLAACSESTSAPEPVVVDDVGAALLTQAAYTTAAPDPFPEGLRLSDAQKAQIALLHEQFRTATAADRTALEAILREAGEARRAGRSVQEVQRILERARPIHGRLEAAGRQLQADVQAVLTAEQRAWLAQQRNRCTVPPMPPLTEAQRTQIAALVQAFETANRADLATLRQIEVEARAARQAGKSDAEIRAILERGAAARARLAAAQRTLQSAIEAILPPRPQAPPCGLRLPG
jgi:Spy/CpxP family protein refolding chaperone